MNDGVYVTQNGRVQNPSWANAGRFLSEVSAPATVRGYYQPLAMISLMLDTVMGGRPDNLRPYHRTSLVLHVLNATLVTVLLYLLLAPFPSGAAGSSPVPGRACVAAMVGLLFGLHPMAVEPVAWLGERKTVLAAFFALLCMIFYVLHTHRRRPILLAASIVWFLLALLAKPIVTPLPVLLLLLDWWPLRRIGIRALVEKLPFFALAGVFAAITVISQRHMELTNTRPLSPADHLLLVCHNIAFYPFKMIRPVGLSPVYPFPATFSFAEPAVLAGVVGTLLLLAVLILSLWRTRSLMMGWLFFFAALLPTLMNVGYSFGIAADKYAYLPAIGLLISLAWVLRRAWAFPSDADIPPDMVPGPAGPVMTIRFPRVAVILVVGLAAVLEARATGRYLAEWQDTGRLSRRILAVAPGTEWAHTQLSSFLLDQGDVAGAISHAQTAVSLDPQSAKAHINLGLALAAKRDAAGATACFNQALRIKPDSAEAHNGLGIVLAERRDYAAAIRAFEASLRSMSDLPEPHFNLGLTLAMRGRPEDAAAAVRHLENAVRLNPRYAAAHLRLADLLSRLGRREDALRHYRKAVDLRPDDPESRTSFAIELGSGGRIREAVEQFAAAVRLAPSNPDMHNNLARALALAGRNEEALQEYREALRLDPKNPVAARALSASTKPGAN